MTQTVKLPNGDTLNFPDEMGDDAIAKVIADNYPEFAPKAAAPRVLAGMPVRDTDAPAPAPAATPDVLAGMPVKKPAPADAPLLDDATNTDPAQNQFGADRMDRTTYERQFRAMNPHASQDAVDAALEQFDARQAAVRKAMDEKRKAGPMKPIPTADQFFNDRLNARLQQRDKGIVQVQPAHEQQDFSNTGTPQEADRPDVATQAGRDLARGWENLKGLNYGFWGLVADTTGHEEAADKLLGEYVRLQNDVAKNNPAVIGSYKNIHDLGDAGRYAVEAVMENAPMILPSLVTGGVGAKIGQAAATRVVGGMIESQVAKGIAREVAEKNAASFIARRVMIGSAGGAAPATIGMEAGNIMGDIYQDTGKKRADLAIGFGIPAGLLDIAEPVMALRKIVGPVADEMVGSVIKRLGVEAGKQFLTESGTEAAQTYLEEWAKSRASGKDVNRKDVMESVIDAALKGGIGGAGMGVGSEGIHEARAKFGEYRAGAAEQAAQNAYDNLGADGANAARDAALSSWNTNGLSPSSRSSGNGGRIEPTWGQAGAMPAPARAEPSIGDIAGAASVDEAIAAAMAVTSQPAAVPTIAPPPSASPFPTAAEIDALEQQAGIVADHTPEESQAAHDHMMGELAARAAEAANPTDPAERQRIADAVDAAWNSTGPDISPPGGKTAAAVDDATDWHPFPAEMRTLGVPRAQMPQIRAEHRGALVNFLNARGISHEQVEVPAESLRPTQREFAVSKVEKALEHQGGNRSILISSDNYVLDGHHQWMAAAVNGQPVQAIRLNAPIKQLVKTVHEFPSSTVDTSSASAAPAAPADPGRELSPYEQAQERNRRQEEVVRQAIERQAQHRAGQAPQQPGSSVPTATERAPAAPVPPPKPTAGQRMRERIHRENPFLGFLATHGLNIEERSDTGGQKGRAGGVIVPGFGGSLYRRTGKRLDELAQLAHEAGFLSDEDINNPSDTGGTRKLADMIERAVHSREVIEAPGLLEAAAPSTNDQLLEEAQRLGIDHAGMDADQLYDAVRAAHAGEDAKRETSGASDHDEQDAIDHYAAQVTPELLADADIPFDLNDPRLSPTHNLTDEEIDAIFGIQKATGPREDRSETQGDAAAPAHEGAAPAGQPSRAQIRERLKTIAQRLGIRVNEANGGFNSVKGMINVPAEDQQAEGAQTPEHVFAHELGHAIMDKRSVSFKGFPVKEVRRYASNWDELVEASKAFRPAVWNHERDKVRLHARKPNEILADAIGSVLIGERPLSMLEPLMSKVGLNEWDMGLRERGKTDGDNLLTSYSRDDVLERDEAAAAAAKAERAEADRLERQRKAEQDAKETKARADATVDDFQLGQDPMAQLSGQADIFADPPAPRAPKQAEMERQEFDAKSGVGKISAVKERYRDDKFGVSWASTNIATADTMEEAAAIARAVAESGADNITDMRRMAAEHAANAAPRGNIVTVTEGPTAQRLRREDRHVFAQPRVHTYDPSQARPVVLISCSDAKLEGGPHRAIDLYKGALFDVLRKWMPENNRPDVFIISAKHGLVHAEDMLESYEQPMTEERLEALMRKGIAARDILNRDFSEVFIAGSAKYRELGQVYAERMRSAGFTPKDVEVLGSAPGAGIGTQRGDLAAYLRGLEAKATPETKRLADELDAERARRVQLDTERRAEYNARQKAESAAKDAQVKTPGTNLVWRDLGEWMAAYSKLDGRAASTKRHVQLNEHIGQLVKNPAKITSETDSRILDEAKKLLERNQAPRGQRESDPATKALQLVGTQLAKALKQQPWNVGQRAMLPSKAKLEGSKEAGFTYGLTGTIESIKDGLATVRVIEPPRGKEEPGYPTIMHGKLAVDVPVGQLLPPGVEISDELLSVGKMETANLEGRLLNDLENDQQGVIVGKPTAINQSLKAGRYTLDDIAGNYGRTRAYLRRVYGDMVTLYRAEPAVEKWHPDTQVVYMGDANLVDKFYRDGRKHVTYRVPVDDILALNVQKNGYYEFIVKRQGEPMARPADPAAAADPGKTATETGKSATEQAESETTADTGAEIPADFYPTVTVQYRALGATEAVDMPAHDALAKTREEIQQLEDMLKCMGA